MWRKAKIKEYEMSIKKNMVGKMLWYEEGSEFVPFLCQEMSANGPVGRFVNENEHLCVITHVINGHSNVCIPYMLLEPLEETLIEPPIEHYLEWWKEEQ